MKNLPCILVTLCAIATICASHGPQPQQASPEIYAVDFLRGLKRLAERARAQGVLNVITERECNLVCPITTVCSLQFIFPRCVPIYNRLPVLDNFYNYPMAQQLFYGQAGLKGALAMHGNLNVPLATADVSYSDPIVTVAKGQATFKGGLAVTGKTTVPIAAVDTSYDEPLSSLANRHTSERGDSSFDAGTKDGSVNTVDFHYDVPVLPTTTNTYSDIINALAWARRTDQNQPAVGRTSKTIIADVGFGLNKCGYMPPECRAIHNELNTSFKYSFDYTLKRCVRVNVCSSCSLLNGARFNLFESQFDCNRFCQ